MPKVITVGEILVEVMAEKVDQSFLAQGKFLGPYPSGAPAIFIDQVAKMGVSSGIIAKVGEDDFGLLNLERLKKDGVDVSQVIASKEFTTGTAFVTYFKDGGRKFIFHFANSAAGALGQDDVKESYLEQAEFVHVMGCSLTASENMRQAVLKAVKAAKEKNIKVSFDPNIRPELLDTGNTRKVFEQILSVTDVLLTGAEEAITITGAANIKDAVKIFKNYGIAIIVTKSGSKGADIFYVDKVTNVSSYAVEEIDPTGAGDCFDGAFVASLVLGKDVIEAARIANAAGALSVTKKGPMEGTVSMEEINSFMTKATQR